jgi:hypothetical protein
MRSSKTSRGVRLVASLGLAVACGAASNVARADGANAPAAEALFAEGRRLVGAGDFANACPKFAESERLDPSVATLLNLGACYEKAGRTASAWATFREAVSAAQAAKRDDYLATAQKRATALEPTLSRLTLLEHDATATGLEIRRDGVVVSQAEWGVPIPVDPGAHVVEASAPTKKPWQTTLTIASGTLATTVEIPTLEDAPAAPAAAVAPPALPPPENQPPPPSTPQNDDAGHTQRILGVVTGAVGIVGLGVGTAFVLSAHSHYDDSLANCTSSKNVCNAAGVSERNSALSAGNLATVFFSVGAAAVAGGAVLWFTAPSSPSSSPRVGLVPAPGGALVRGEF